MGRPRKQQTPAYKVRSYAEPRTFGQMVDDGTVVPAKSPHSSNGTLLRELRDEQQRYNR